MQTISFFTPVTYQEKSRTFKQRLITNVDDYFYLGGKKASVLKNFGNHKEEVELMNASCSTLKSALKVASYCTVIIPLIFLVIKSAFRSKVNYFIAEKKCPLSGENAYRRQISFHWKSKEREKAILLLRDYISKYQTIDLKAEMFDCHKKSVEFVQACLFLWMKEGGKRLTLITGVGYHSKHPKFHMQSHVISFLEEKPKSVKILKDPTNLGRLLLSKV